MSLKKEVCRSLLTGKFRHWRPPHYRIYNSMLGNARHIGIELEFKAPSGYDVSELQKEDPKIHDSSNLVEEEIIRLFQVSDPKLLVKELRDFFSLLSRHKIWTLGSWHINVQKDTRKDAKKIRASIDLLSWVREDDSICEYPEHNQIGRWDLIDRGNDAKSNSSLYYRREFKKVFPMLNWEDLLIQFCLCYNYTRLEVSPTEYRQEYVQKIREKREVENKQLLDTFYSVYPSGRKLARTLIQIDRIQG